MHNLQVSSRAKIGLSTFSIVLIIGIAAEQVTQNIWFALTLVAGIVAIALCIGLAPSPELRWSPTRIFPPVLALYSFGSIALNPDQYWKTQALATTLAVAGFTLGSSFVTIGMRPRITQTGPSELRHAFAPSLPLVLSIAGLGVLSATYLASLSGGFPLMSANSNAARLTFFPNGLWSTLVVVSLQFGTVAPLGYLALKGLQVPHARLYTITGFTSSVLLMLLGNRGMLVAPFIAIAICFLWGRKLRLGLTALAGVTLVGLVSYMGLRRNIAAFGSTYLGDLETAGYAGSAVWFAPILAYLKGTSETFSRSIYLIEEKIGFQMGAQFFSPVLGTESADLFIKNQLGLNFEGFGLAVGYVNAFFLDFGLVGTFIGPLLFGLATATIFRHTLASPNIGWTVTYAYLLSRTILSIYGHPFAYAYYAILPLLILLSFTSKRRQAPMEISA